MRLWLVRHGATDWSETGRLCGWTDIPLSSQGRRQAELVRSWIHGRKFEGVWSSDLIRAADFARLAVGGASSDVRLRELDFGELEGRSWHDCDHPTRNALLRFEGFAAPGGESVAELGERVAAFLSGLAIGDHLVFTHGGVIRLLTHQRGITSSPAPGELTILDWVAPRQNVLRAREL